MSEPFLGEVKMTSFNFAPKGWALCNGQLMPINQNQALFSLLGTTYGGNGMTTFALPDLRGCTPIHKGQNFIQGQKAGEEAHTVTISELPTHIHPVFFSGQNAGQKTVAGNFPARTTSRIYGAPTSLVPMNTGILTNIGGSQPHVNMQPYLVISFCIALQGIFPSQS